MERGTWEMPGGAVEAGESLPDAARREAREEASVAIAVGRPLHFGEWTSKRGRFVHVVFLATARGRTRGSSTSVSPGAADVGRRMGRRRPGRGD